MKHLLAVGACYLDTILTVPHYPPEDTKLRATHLLHRRGGNSPNTLDVLSQLLDDAPTPSALSLILCAVLPSRSSPATQDIAASFPPAVDLSRCVFREHCREAPASYVIRSAESGSRTIVNYNEVPEMTREEFEGVVEGVGTGLAWCHFEGRIPDVTLACIRHLRRRRLPAVRISVELEKPDRAGLQDLAAEADVVFYSKTWAQGNGYDTPESCLRAQAALTPNASLLCCTWGDAGASALSLPTSTYAHTPAFTLDPPLPVIDTVGAGDAFIAGMLYGLLCRDGDWEVERKLAFANEVAGRKVLREGLGGLGGDLLRTL